MARGCYDIEFYEKLFGIPGAASPDTEAASETEVRAGWNDVLDAAVDCEATELGVFKFVATELETIEFETVLISVEWNWLTQTLVSELYAVTYSVFLFKVYSLSLFWLHSFSMELAQQKNS